MLKLKRSLNSSKLSVDELGNVKKLINVVRPRMAGNSRVFAESDQFRLFSVNSDIRGDRWVAGLEVLPKSVGEKGVSKKFIVKKVDDSRQEIVAHENIKLDRVNAVPGVVELLCYDQAEDLLFYPKIEGKDCKKIYLAALLGIYSANKWFQIERDIAKWLARLHSLTCNHSNERVSLDSYFSGQECDSNEVYERIKIYLSDTTQFGKECIHGDFLLPNIIHFKSELNVIDWEHYRIGAGLEDCIRYLVGLISVGRLFPHRWTFIQKSISVFLKTYAQETKNLHGRTMPLVIIAAILEVQRWQRWDPEHRWRFSGKLYFPMLMELKKQSIELWEESGSVEENC